MSEPISRRAFAAASAGVILASAADLPAAEDKPTGPTESTFERDYAAPSFKPSWKSSKLIDSSCKTSSFTRIPIWK